MIKKRISILVMIALIAALAIFVVRSDRGRTLRNMEAEFGQVEV
jgi:branched-subunit amino acid ABC-type transport system permease component